MKMNPFNIGPSPSCDLVIPAGNDEIVVDVYCRIYNDKTEVIDCLKL
jgi:hypothetical protein